MGYGRGWWHGGRGRGEEGDRDRDRPAMLQWQAVHMSCHMSHTCYTCHTHTQASQPSPGTHPHHFHRWQAGSRSCLGTGRNGSCVMAVNNTPQPAFYWQCGRHGSKGCVHVQAGRCSKAGRQAQKNRETGEGLGIHREGTRHVWGGTAASTTGSRQQCSNKQAAMAHQAGVCPNCPITGMVCRNT